MKFRLIASSDTHGTVMPIKYADNKPANHGFLKMLSTMEDYINEDTIVIDNGDIIEGSPFTTYSFENLKDENPMSKCVNTIYDYINIGNHDFNYGQDYLLKYISDFKGVCLCGNVKYNNQRLGNEYTIHTFSNGKKIALIGCVTQYITNYEKEQNLIGIEVEDCYDYCKKTIAKIKNNEEVEAIVIVYHGGFEKDFNGKEIEKYTGENEGYKMCAELDFDIMISGHQHLSLAGKCFGKLVSQTNKDAKEFAVIDFDTDKKDGEVRLIPSDVEVKSKYLLMFDDIEAKVQTWLDKPIGYISNYDLKIKDGFDARLNKHPLISFLNDVQIWATKAELSGVALFNDAVGFNEKITMRDLVSTYVYPNTLYKLEIDGKTLRKYLEKNAEYFSLDQDKIVVSKPYYEFKQKHYNYDMIDGVDYTIKVSNPIGQRIIELKRNGKVINDDDIFTIVINNFRYSGVGGFDFMNQLKIIQKYDEDMVTTLAKYFKMNQNITLKHRSNIKVII